MSIWTHVAGVIRVDWLRIFDDDGKAEIEKIIGKPCLYNDWYPETTIPCGSEGSLEYSIHENPNKHALAAYVVSIWGDLRDYDNVDAIGEWFKDICVKCGAVRNAVIQIECENGVRSVIEYNAETI